MEAFDVAALADPGYPDAVAFTVLFVYLLHRFFPEVLLGRADATDRLDAGDGGVKVWTGYPEPGRHVAGMLVFYYAR